MSTSKFDQFQFPSQAILIISCTMVFGILGLVLRPPRRAEDFEGGERLPLSCHCKKVQGSLAIPKRSSDSVKPGLHASCLCVDCVKWTRDVCDHGAVDPFGASESFVVSPAQVKFEDDSKSLIRQVRLYETRKGTHRMMTSCCKTDVGTFVDYSSILFLSVGLLSNESERKRMVQDCGPQEWFMAKDRKDSSEFKDNPKVHRKASLGMILKMIRFSLASSWEMKELPILPVPQEEFIFQREE